MKGLNLFKTNNKGEVQFSIIEEYAALTPKRKSALYDQICSDNLSTFSSTVELLWPAASEQDMKKLRNFLILLKQTAN